MMLELDGPSLQKGDTITDSTVYRVKHGASEYDERKVVTIQPIDGHIWVFFGNGVNTPSALDVKNNGFFHRKESTKSYEAGTSQPVFIIADVGNVDVRFAERG